ncbi:MULTISPECIES: homoserine dehydrogenase [Methanosphaera]|uniref:Homoserine dehydrogenase n=2 Tax=Methanosphaera stadtmanae TaxID=2317 RepID=Q2NH16_METST|nr:MULTISPECIES: homoserine dehydrogenase [Methanosphaera]ABC56887.1 putative homoserine dehydrogenase [Methanosphaera stadtmanae DSM 3091]MEE0490243.1 homoserine dehydrogenase [Methanosphaera stadtmanae]OEC88596.1 homoserine dehydrogenase [Methanosphaera sp. A6]RAP03441.1 homoserine dehydrogenase [Methanosphaera stadtmanae]RAP48062.1 MAG: homoserine dehydrogenase [Methanosphaera sp. DEW79]
MTSNKMRLCVLGFGAVGQGLAKVVLMKHEELIEKYGIDLEITAISDRSGAAINPNGLDLQQALDTKEKTGKIKDYPEYGVSGVDGVEVLDKAEYDCLVEATPTNIDDGQPTQTHILKAMNDKKDVVTSNKGPLALNFKTLIETARENNVKFRFEASVGGTMPVINLARESLAGNNIHSVQGILNGTTNYILSRMANEGTEYEPTLKEAQELGIAETNPYQDVEGLDAACKIVIIANSLMGWDVTLDDVSREGISGISSNAVKLALKDGYLIKLVAEANDGKLRVAPMLVKQGSPFAVNGTLNVITLKTDLSEDVTVVGVGAGSIETASAILSDIISIGKNNNN